MGILAAMLDAWLLFTAHGTAHTLGLVLFCLLHIVLEQIYFDFVGRRPPPPAAAAASHGVGARRSKDRQARRR